MRSLTRCEEATTLAYAAIPLACWFAAFIATPRKPCLGNEIEELVYSRLLGRQELLRLLASIVTGLAFLAFVLGLANQGARDAGFDLASRHYCTPPEADVPHCDTFQPDGRWRQEL
jgi:hypothetical protein